MASLSGNSSTNNYIVECATLYRRTLLENVVPFWIRHGIDRTHGGLGNVLDDQGNPLGADKYIWSQGRALWTFSALFNRVQPNAEWLAIATHIFSYLRENGRDELGRWMFRLDGAGHVLDGSISIYADGFALAGLTEYYAATGDADARTMAIETYESTRARIASPGSYGVAPYEIPPGLKTHGVNMIFALFYFELGRTLKRQDVQTRGIELAHEILEHFYVAKYDAIMEFVDLDGQSVDSPEGRACVPGHAIEALWFLLYIFEQVNDLERLPLCWRLIRRHLELAWDEQYGGLMLAIDVEGQQPTYWKNAECKPWWVQVEALVATAYAYAQCREKWCLDWHLRVQNFAFSHYPVATGEWTPWVDRQGRKMSNSVLPVKDPFHLPRGLMYMAELFESRIGGTIATPSHL